MNSGVVFVVEDDDLVLASLTALLSDAGHDVRGFSSGGAFLEKVEPRADACVLLDLHLPDMSGLDIQEKLLARKIELPIILVTADGDVASAVKAMKAGAVDFLEKPFQSAHMLERVAHALTTGRTKRAVADVQADARRRLATLSPRETEVVELVVAGRANKQIAIALKISSKTVELHRGAAMRKLGARHVSEMVATWISAHPSN